jgi:hypothetical protein
MPVHGYWQARLPRYERPRRALLHFQSAMGQDPLAGDVPLTTLAKEYHQKWLEARRRMQAAAQEPAPQPKMRLFAVVMPPVHREDVPQKPRLPPIADPQLRSDLRAILDQHDTTWEAIVNHDRKAPTHKPRRAVYGYLHRRGWSVAKIGRFCNRDHTSILHALRKGQRLGEYTDHSTGAGEDARGLSLCLAHGAEPKDNAEV